MTAVTLLAALLSLSSASPQAAGPLQVRMRETIVIEVIGATAAYVVDPDIADVTLAGGTVRIYARQAGTTKVVVVVLNDILSYDLEVSAPRRMTPASAEPSRLGAAGVDTSYSSETDRLTTSVDTTSRVGDRSTRIAATHVARTGVATSDARNSIAAATVEITRGDRRLTLLDQLVRSSPLTLDGSRVRGVHYSDARFDLHAGLASPLLYQSFILPAESSSVIGGSVRFKAGPVQFIPNAHWYPTSSRLGGSSGATAGMRLEHVRTDGRLRLGAEAGYGGELAGAGDLSYEGDRHHVNLLADHRPSGFPSLGGTRPYGTTMDGRYATRLSPALTFNLTATAARQELVSSEQRTGSSNAELRATLNRQWSVTFGSSVGVFDNKTTRLTSVTIPIGALWQGSLSSASGVFRYQQNSGRNDGGLGGRLRLHRRFGQVKVGGYVDYQRDAATVDLVFREAPELARLFAELGFAARTVEDLTRLLREQDVLIASGYLERATLNTSPSRMQTSVDAAWSGRGPAAPVLRFSLLADRVESTHGGINHLLSTLSYSRRLRGSTELTATVTRWTSQNDGRDIGKWSYGLGLRVRLSALADIASVFRNRSITGHVVQDDGTPDGANGQPMPGVRLRLDDGREIVSDEAGRFRFSGVGPGARRVEALLPPAPGARFTTPAAMVVRPGEEATFQIGYLPARLIGIVRDDAGAPVAGVRVRVTCGAVEDVAVTDTAGRYAMDRAEGECRAGVDAASVPVGYDASTTPEQTARLVRAEPARLEHVLGAHRSIAGKVPAGAGTVRLVETGDGRRPDADGRFVFRNLKPGTYTLAFDIEDRHVTRTVTVPHGPALITIEVGLN